MSRKSHSNKPKDPRSLPEINAEYNQALKELGLMQYEMAAKKIQIELKNKRISEIITEGNQRASLDKLNADKAGAPAMTSAPKDAPSEVANG